MISKLDVQQRAFQTGILISRIRKKQFLLLYLLGSGMEKRILNLFFISSNRLFGPNISAPDQTFSLIAL